MSEPFVEIGSFDRSIDTEILDREMTVSELDSYHRVSVWVAPFWLSLPESSEDNELADELVSILNRARVESKTLPKTEEKHFEAIGMDTVAFFILNSIVLPTVIGILSNFLYAKLDDRKNKLRVLLYVKRGNAYVKATITGDVRNVSKELHRTLGQVNKLLREE